MILVDKSIQSTPTRNGQEVAATRSDVQKKLQDLISRLDELNYYELLTVGKVVDGWLDKP